VRYYNYLHPYISVSRSERSITIVKRSYSKTYLIQIAIVPVRRIISELPRTNPYSLSQHETIHQSLGSVVFFDHELLLDVGLFSPLEHRSVPSDIS
jgi:hypothetical protein